MILLLAGTTEARNLADHLASSGIKCVAVLEESLTDDKHYAIETRDGRFCGEEEFLSFVKDAGITAVIDASPAFAPSLTAQAVRICEKAALPYLRYERAPWRSQPGDAWHQVSGYGGLADLIPEGARVVCLDGALDSAEVAVALQGRDLISRVAVSSEKDEVTQLGLERPDWLVMANAGGSGGVSRSTLDAARTCGLQVAMVVRPRSPEGMERREHLLDALEWAENHAMRHGGML